MSVFAWPPGPALTRRSACARWRSRSTVWRTRWLCTSRWAAWSCAAVAVVGGGGHDTRQWWKRHRNARHRKRRLQEPLTRGVARHPLRRSRRWARRRRWAPATGPPAARGCVGRRRMGSPSAAPTKRAAHGTLPHWLQRASICGPRGGAPPIQGCWRTHAGGGRPRRRARWCSRGRGPLPHLR